jgi:DNA-directed RNA polymerase specialized sigma24 family protein
MKNYQDSDYAANKYAGGIVYRFADSTVEITPEDYLRENPGKTEADFAELKALSDRLFYEQDRAAYRQTWKDVSIHGLDETEQCASSSPEDEIIDKPAQATVKKQRQELAKKGLNALTETQRRRYILHVVKGLTMREIATCEGISHPSVVESLLAAEKKLKKVLAEG